MPRTIAADWLRLYAFVPAVWCTYIASSRPESSGHSEPSDSSAPQPLRDTIGGRISSPVAAAPVPGGRPAAVPAAVAAAPAAPSPGSPPSPPRPPAERVHARLDRVGTPREKRLGTRTADRLRTVRPDLLDPRRPPRTPPPALPDAERDLGDLLGRARVPGDARDEEAEGGGPLA